MEERRSQRKTAGKERHGMEQEVVSQLGSVQTPVRSLTGKQQPQLSGLPGMLLLVLPQQMGLEREKLSPGKGNAVGAPRSSAVGSLPEHRGQDVGDALWGGHGPEEPRGVDEDMYEVHEDSFQPPL